MMYSGFVFIVSYIMLTAWTTPEKNQQAQRTNYSKVQADENIIYITAEGYSIPEVWIAKTQPLTFTNMDNAVHSVTDDYGEFDSGPLNPGQSFTISFPHAGVWTYHDEFSKATGIINVMGRDE